MTLLTLALLLPGCADSREARTDAPPDLPATPAASADSLVLTTPGGAEVWYTLVREARGSDGASCTERGLEIRRDGARLLVPLLYTRDSPQLFDDTTITARLYRDCVPGDRYRVSLRTAQPTPIR